MGHTVSFWITLCLMLLVGGVILREAVVGPRSYARTRKDRYGPFATFVLAALLIMVEPTRHVAQDADWWPECSNNPSFPGRINSTDSYPSSCLWSSSQYHCAHLCCVPTWQPALPATKPLSYEWTPPSADFYGGVEGGDAGGGPFATVRPDGTIYLGPDGKVQDGEPLYTATAEAPLALWGDGSVNKLRKDDPHKGCKYGVNEATGYCLLTDPTLPHEEQLKQLPLLNPSKPHNETTNPHVCTCNHCIDTEDMFHLSTVGILSTIVATYLGFALLAFAVAWNANLHKKLGRIKQQWRQLRGIQ